ncbi:MAG TPA: GNAT family N-acetyltransferase [Steroidobacteraceae bacterium]|nr:GNAT family N-acetyltransferase [Steroidobacteraceae bacterium]
MDAKRESLQGGSVVEVRPVGPDDVEREREFITGLSPQSRRFRFLDTLNEPSEGLLRRLTSLDPKRDAALAAVDPATGRFVGVARFSREPDGAAEMAVAVTDAWQHRGIGTLLARRLIAEARNRGIGWLYSIDPVDNHAMQRFATRLGFQHRVNADDASQLTYTLELN